MAANPSGVNPAWPASCIARLKLARVTKEAKHSVRHTAHADAATIVVISHGSLDRPSAMNVTARIDNVMAAMNEIARPHARKIDLALSDTGTPRSGPSTR